MLLRTAAATVLVASLGGLASAAPQPTKVHVGLSASFVTAGGGKLWVTDHRAGRLVKVDPAGGSVKARVAVAGYPFGIAYGAGSVWVGSRYQNRVTRINAKTERRQARIHVGDAPYALVYGAGSVWVTNEGSGSVSRSSPRRNKVTKTIRVGGQPDGIALAFGKAWVADYGRGRLIRVDPKRNRVERSIDLPHADWITPGLGSLWVSSEAGNVYRVDPATMTVQATVTVGANPLASAWIGGRLWVPNIDSNTVSVVDPATATATVERTIPVGPSPIALAAAAGSARVTSEFDGELWRFDP